MAPFFVGGILCCKYEWQKYLESYLALAVTSLMFILWNVLDVMPDPMAFVSISTGIMFSFSLCLNLTKLWPWLFSSFRDYTYQIFLMGIFIQMPIRWIYVKMNNEILFVPLWFTSILLGIYIPTYISKIIEKNMPKIVKLCFGL